MHALLRTGTLSDLANHCYANNYPIPITIKNYLGLFSTGTLQQQQQQQLCHESAKISYGSRYRPVCLRLPSKKTQHLSIWRMLQSILKTKHVSPTIIIKYRLLHTRLSMFCLVSHGDLLDHPGPSPMTIMRLLLAENGAC